MTMTLPQCAFCKHLRRDDLSGNRCGAFHAGIPAEVFLNEHDHREPYPGDNDVRFEPVDDEAAEIVARMFDDDDVEGE